MTVEPSNLNGEESVCKTDGKQFESACGLYNYHMEKHLVVAKYKEDVAWLESVQGWKTHLYDKLGDPDTANLADHYEVLPNVGKESHTYCHYILKHYHNLPDVVVFAQGHPFDHSPRFLEILQQETWTGMSSVVKKTSPRSTLHHNWAIGLGHFWLGDERFKWKLREKATIHLAKNLGYPKPPYPLKSCWGAIWAVKRSGILNQSFEFYENLSKDHHDWYALPWALESLWWYVFTDFPLHL